MKKGQPSSKKNKYWIDRTDINEDAFIFLRGSKWHLHIAKQPHWKAPVNKSMQNQLLKGYQITLQLDPLIQARDRKSVV